MRTDKLTGLNLLSSIKTKMKESLLKMKEVGYIYFEISNYDALLDSYPKKDLDALVSHLGESMKEQKGKLFREGDSLVVNPKHPWRFLLFLFSPPRHKETFTDTDLKLVSTRGMYKLNLFLQEECGYREVAESACLDSGYSSIHSESEFKLTFEQMVFMAHKQASFQAHKDKIMAALISNISHELRTPLTCIKGYAESLLEGAYKKKELCKKFITIINEESQRLERLIYDLLDISMIDSRQIQMKCKEVDVCQLIRLVCDTMNPWAEKAEIKLEEKLFTDSLVIDIDPDRIKQVLVILIDNAVKYSKKDTTIEVALEKEDHNYLIKVTDQGIGISDSEKFRVFERFYRSEGLKNIKKEGRGLGLSIAKFIVESHGGSISIDKEYRKGSRFLIRLPIEDKE